MKYRYSKDKFTLKAQLEWKSKQDEEEAQTYQKLVAKHPPFLLSTSPAKKISFREGGSRVLTAGRLLTWAVV